MESFHRHLDELERLLSDDDKKKRIKESVLCYAAYCGSTPVMEALILKGVGKKYYNENHSMSIEIMVTKCSHLSFGLHHHTQSAVLLNC